MTSQILDSEFNHYLTSLLKGDGTSCKAVVQALLNQHIEIIDIYENLIRRSLYQIGDLWAKNLISVADEHIATAITENLLTQIQTRVIAARQLDKTVLVSCVTADYHQIGAKMVANLFELSGWSSYYLGANMPVSDLIVAIDRIKPDVICLSFALIELLKPLEVTIREIRFKYPEIPIIVGGQADSGPYHQSVNLSQFRHIHLLNSISQLEQFIAAFNGEDPAAH